MKNKINFKKPVFIIPLIILPFLFIFYYIFFQKGKQPELVEEVHIEGFNSDLPNAKKSISTPDKLTAYQEALKQRRMESGMKDISQDRGKRKLENESEAQSIKDSLKVEFAKANKKQKEASQAAENRRRAVAKSREALSKIRDKQQTRNGNSSSNTAQRAVRSASTPQDREMEAFKKQMTYIDSMNNPEKYAKKAMDLNGEVTEKETEKVHELTKTNSNNATNTNYFNTIKADLGKTMISAILDEGIKAWEGSRVRIRLLEEIFIDGRLLKKGQYLYGTVSGFTAQRLIINVNSVIIEDEIFPMQVSLYDNDGMEGIYIPDSSFRSFTKELGARSSQGSIDISDAPDSNSQALYQSVTSAVKSSTKAIQNALRKNKARLKYNTQVFLVNTNK